MAIQGVRYQLTIYSKNVLTRLQDPTTCRISLVINVSFRYTETPVFYFLTTSFQNGVQRYMLG